MTRVVVQMMSCKTKYITLGFPAGLLALLLEIVDVRGRLLEVVSDYNPR